ncbi:MAG TPA: hypothetical protein VKB75_06340, partial [Jatrophihabitans sp.]|nr:hypothetical protein [Jatrophihabitans sp.]
MDGAAVRLVFAVAVLAAVAVVVVVVVVVGVLLAAVAVAAVAAAVADVVGAGWPEPTGRSSGSAGALGGIPGRSAPNELPDSKATFPWRVLGMPRARESPTPAGCANAARAATLGASEAVAGVVPAGVALLTGVVGVVLVNGGVAPDGGAAAVLVVGAVVLVVVGVVVLVVVAVVVGCVVVAVVAG